MSPVGFVGLGQMGAPMARHLLDWPDGLIVYDARSEATTEFVAGGAKAAATPRQVAETAEVISVMVRDDAQVTDVVCGQDGLLESAAPGAVIAIHATIGEQTAPVIAERAERQGVHVVDAPVSGGAMGAQRGELAVMVGADEAAFPRCEAAFRPWAGLVMHAGPVGAGTRAKLARNLLHFIAFTAATEAQRLAEAAGVDLGELGKVVRHSDAITGGPGAIMVRDSTGPLSDEDGLRPIFTNVRDLGEKDLALAVELGERLGVDLPLGRLALRDLAAGLGVADETGKVSEA